jgi:hypothetical protein
MGRLREPRQLAFADDRRHQEQISMPAICRQPARSTIHEQMAMNAGASVDHTTH